MTLTSVQNGILLPVGKIKVNGYICSSLEIPFLFEVDGSVNNH